MFSKKPKNSTPADADGASAPAVKKPKRGEILQDQSVSIRKINAGRESKINFAARTNMLFAMILFANVAFTCFKITQSRPPSDVFVQYYSQAGLMVRIQPVHQTQLPPPRTEAASQPAQAAEPSAQEARPAEPPPASASATAGEGAASAPAEPAVSAPAETASSPAQ